MVVSVSMLLAGLVSPLGAEGPAGEKRLIEWGWDEPDTRFLRENVGRVEQMPFDGLVFHATSSRGGNLTWEMWGGRRFEIGEFREAIEDLKATPRQRFSELFLRVNVTPGKVDWFDDSAWDTVRHNFGVAALLAKEGGVRGFMFDVEQYEGGLFDYRKQARREERSWDEYRAKVRQRGREWMQEVNRGYGDITILLTFGYRIAQPEGGKERSEVSYGLLADFLDGMLDACTPETRLVDAWEFSYPYKTDEQFRRAVKTIKEESLDWTADRPKYARHVEAGFGLWMDYNWRALGWNESDLTKNHFPPAEFEAAVRLALSASDRYVWIYTEQPRWWPRERLPQAYVDALRAARGPATP